MAIKGLYKHHDPELGEVVAMDWGGVQTFERDMRRHHYEASRYQPPFDELPTREQYLERTRP